MTRFTLPAPTLYHSADWVSRVVPPKSPAPILKGILITAKDDQVALTGYDYEQSAAATIDDVMVRDEGKVLIPSAFLVAVAKAAGARADITIDSSKEPVTITAGKAVWTVRSLPWTDYPLLPDLGEPLGEVDAEDFSTAVARVAPAASKNTELPGLTGVHMSAEGDTLTLAATDRFRLAVATLPWKPSSNAPDLPTLVPAAGLAVLAKGDTGSTATLYSGHVFGYSSGRRQSTVRHLDLDGFPKYRQLIPALGDRWTEVNILELKHAVDQVALAAETKELQVQFNIDSDQISLSLPGEEKTASTEIAAETSGEPIRIALNIHYLRDALAAVGGDRARFYITTPNKPILFVAENYTHLLMPVRLPG